MIIFCEAYAPIRKGTAFPFGCHQKLNQLWYQYQLVSWPSLCKWLKSSWRMYTQVQEEFGLGTDYVASWERERQRERESRKQNQRERQREWHKGFGEREGEYAVAFVRNNVAVAYVCPLLFCTVCLFKPSLVSVAGKLMYCPQSDPQRLDLPRTVVFFFSFFFCLFLTAHEGGLVLRHL